MSLLCGFLIMLVKHVELGYNIVVISMILLISYELLSLYNLVISYADSVSNWADSKHDVNICSPYVEPSKGSPHRQSVLLKG